MEKSKTISKTQEKENSRENKQKEAKKKAKSIKIRSKKYKLQAAKIEKGQAYRLSEGIKLAQDTSYTQFSATIEAHINTYVSNLRGLVSMPYLSGKSLKILAFGEKASESGADTIGTDNSIDQISKGKIGFDVIIATAEWMPKLAKVARILGPRGLMPNPKNGTITENLSKAVEELKGGKTEYKTEPKGKIIHLGIGKVNQPAEEISANLKSLYNIIGRSKIRKITVAATMGPGIKIDLTSLS